jgi:hypothetical protein
VSSEGVIYTDLLRDLGMTPPEYHERVHPLDQILFEEAAREKIRQQNEAYEEYDSVA